MLTEKSDGGGGGLRNNRNAFKKAVWSFSIFVGLMFCSQIILLLQLDRRSAGVYNWLLFTPLFITSIIFSLIAFKGIYRDIRQNLYSLFLLLPSIVYLIIFIIKTLI